MGKAPAWPSVWRATVPSAPNPVHPVWELSFLQQGGLLHTPAWGEPGKAAKAAWTTSGGCCCGSAFLSSVLEASQWVLCLCLLWGQSYQLTVGSRRLSAHNETDSEKWVVLLLGRPCRPWAKDRCCFQHRRHPPSSSCSMEDEEGGGARTAGSPLLWKLLMMAKGKPRPPQLWPAARGLGPILLPPPWGQGASTPSTPWWQGNQIGEGGGACSHHQGPRGHTLAFLEARGFFRFLWGWTRPRRAGGTGRDGGLSGCPRRPVCLLPPPLPPAPPPVAPNVLSPPDPGPGTPILTAILRTHDYLGSHRCPQGCPLKHVSTVCVTVSMKQQKEN